ncbi:MAG: exodeoxyribonuclease III [Rickettsiales bacterium]|nr:exodeoxyribonuclease III [Rickettsiales bacterium]
MTDSTTRIASWNINSVRIRQPILQAYIDQANPDILCLQETKVEDHLFPEMEMKALGFEHVAFAGQKSYNGVAILSKLPLSDVSADDIIGNGEKRHIAATLPDGTRLHNVYIPAGGDIPDPEENPKFKDKLAFLDRLTQWSADEVAGKQKSIIVGDMNIAPFEHDVWSHKQLLKVVSHTPIEVERMAAFRAAGEWIDTHREHVPMEEKLYSWWSYRSREWPGSNRGRRLDHIWITPQLRSQLTASDILPEARGWEKPSDHVPISIDLEGMAA